MLNSARNARCESRQSEKQGGLDPKSEPDDDDDDANNRLCEQKGAKGDRLRESSRFRYDVLGQAARVLGHLAAARGAPSAC